MAQPSSLSTDLITLVSALGGPTVDPKDIEWATDLPAGKKLIEWLVEQSRGAEGDIDEQYRLYASLDAIVLQEDELQR